MRIDGEQINGHAGRVVVQLQASGVQVTWLAPGAGEAPFRYNAYRNGTLIGSAVASGSLSVRTKRTWDDR